MIGNIVGTAIGIKLVNGKIKPKFGLVSIIAITLMIIFVIVFCGTLIYGIINTNIETIFYSICGIFGFGYILLISPYTQRSSNYYIEFPNEQSLVGFKLSYKGKLVDIKYIVCEDGKIAFADNNKKLSCISYVDGTKMGNLTKYKVINYFVKWLNDNKLLSNKVTISFEKM